MSNAKRYHSRTKGAPKKMTHKNPPRAAQLPLAGIVAPGDSQADVASLQAIPAEVAGSWREMIADYRRLEKELAEERIINQALRLAAEGNLPALPVVGRS